MRITLIGSGNVSTVLGRKIFHSGHIIHEVFSRNLANAQSLAAELSSQAVAAAENLELTADMYVISLADDALTGASAWLQLNDRLVVHTAGSVSIEVLKNISSNYGVLYPLQTIRKEMPDVVLPILVDANNAWNKSRITAFAQSFADSVNYADDEQRRKLHLAAVISNNFSNHLFALTEAYCLNENVDFKMILPLLEETVKRMYTGSPAALQTGPAARNDQSTLAKHREMLAQYPELLRWYELFTESIALRSLKLKN